MRGELTGAAFASGKRKVDGRLRVGSNTGEVPALVASDACVHAVSATIVAIATPPMRRPGRSVRRGRDRKAIAVTLRRRRGWHAPFRRLLERVPQGDETRLA